MINMIKYVSFEAVYDYTIINWSIKVIKLRNLTMSGAPACIIVSNILTAFLNWQRFWGFVLSVAYNVTGSY